MRRVNEETRRIEGDLVGKKRWDMIGEVKATDRPENSLLEAVADVDRLSKPVPIITKEYTSTVEELIKTRIKDENFDDVQPLMVAPKSVRSSFELSQERSSKGLGQLYEEEFLQKSVNTASKPSEKVTALVNEIDDLYEKVDLPRIEFLSDYQCTTKISFFARYHGN
jgi:U3 small nucleolar RNA-associated protein MPP10